MLDANESLDTPFSAMAKFVCEHDLIDLHTVHHHYLENPPPATYTCGRKKIDFIFESQAVAGNFDNAGSHSFYQVFNSDHRGLFVDIDLAALLCGDPCHAENNSTRTLHSHNMEQVDKNKLTLLNFLQDHSMRSKPSNSRQWLQTRRFPRSWL